MGSWGSWHLLRGAEAQHGRKDWANKFWWGPISGHSRGFISGTMEPSLLSLISAVVAADCDLTKWLVVLHLRLTGNTVSSLVAVNNNALFLHSRKVTHVITHRRNSSTYPNQKNTHSEFILFLLLSLVFLSVTKHIPSTSPISAVPPTFKYLSAGKLCVGFSPSVCVCCCRSSLRHFFYLRARAGSPNTP